MLRLYTDSFMNILIDTPGYLAAVNSSLISFVIDDLQWRFVQVSFGWDGKSSSQIMVQIFLSEVG